MKRRSVWFRWIVLFMAAICLLCGCAKKAAPSAVGESLPPKYIFLFIGDGMGAAQAALLGDYRGVAQGLPDAEMPNFSKFSAVCGVTTYNATGAITDSAAAGTAIACGAKAKSGVLGISAKGKKLESMAEQLKDEDYKIGLISSASLDHATPAAFYANVSDRGNYYEIGKQLAKSGFDYFGGGGFRSIGTEKEGQPPIIELAEKEGYLIADTEAEIAALGKGSGKCIAISPLLQPIDQSMPMEIDRSDAGLRLVDFLRKGIEVLGDEQPFFMMCESGMIDWACHTNDAASALRELEELEKAIGAALEFYESHPQETLILVTGDHETGGLSLGVNSAAYSVCSRRLDAQKGSVYEAMDQKIQGWRKQKTPFEEAMKEASALLGISEPDGEELARLKAAYAMSMLPVKQRNVASAEYRRLYSYSSAYEPFGLVLGRIASEQAGIGWTTTAHTGTPVPLYAIGVGADAFEGIIDNTEICKKLLAICNA